MVPIYVPIFCLPGFFHSFFYFRLSGSFVLAPSSGSGKEGCVTGCYCSTSHHLLSPSYRKVKVLARKKRYFLVSSTVTYLWDQETMLSKDDVQFWLHDLTRKKGAFFFLVVPTEGWYADKEQTRRIQQQPDERARLLNLMREHWLPATVPSGLNSCHSESVTTAVLISELREKVALSNVGLLSSHSWTRVSVPTIIDNQTWLICPVPTGCYSVLGHRGQLTFRESILKSSVIRRLAMFVFWYNLFEVPYRFVAI